MSQHLSNLLVIPAIRVYIRMSSCPVVGRYVKHDDDYSMRYLISAPISGTTRGKR